MVMHTLKIQPRYMERQLDGSKNFEIRENDRDFQVGDSLLLVEYDGENKTGRHLTVVITYITDYLQRSGVVVLGTRKETEHGYEGS